MGRCEWEYIARKINPAVSRMPDMVCACRFMIPSKNEVTKYMRRYREIYGKDKNGQRVVHKKLTNKVSAGGCKIHEFGIQ